MYLLGACLISTLPIWFLAPHGSLSISESSQKVYSTAKIVQVVLATIGSIVFSSLCIGPLTMVDQELLMEPLGLGATSPQAKQACRGFKQLSE